MRELYTVKVTEKTSEEERLTRRVIVIARSRRAAMIEGKGLLISDGGNINGNYSCSHTPEVDLRPGVGIVTWEFNDIKPFKEGENAASTSR